VADSLAGETGETGEDGVARTRHRLREIATRKA
jgi:hypothetical protein